MARQSVTLYLEDSTEDIVLLERSFIKATYSGKLIVLHDGAEGKAYMLGEGEYADRSKHPLPDLIICDIKMPLVSGDEFVLWLRDQEAFKTLPVFMFSSSDLLRNKSQSLLNGANRYFIKPMALDLWANTAKEMLEAAFSIAPATSPGEPPK